MRTDHDPQTYSIIGAAMDVHRTLGPGLLEVCYQDALIWELEQLGVSCAREVEVPVRYKHIILPHHFRADLICYGDVLVELKAHSGLSDVDIAQVVHYLRATGIRRGLLLNFGLPSLQFRRLVFDPRPKLPSEESLQSVAPAWAAAPPPA